MSYDERMLRLKELLDQQHTWPGVYVFKFIVPGQKTSELKKIVAMEETFARPSASGKYSSLTFEKTCQDSDEVIEIYQKVSKIKGVVTL